MGAIMSGIMEGGGGVRSTQLTVAIDEDDTTLQVSSTEGFLESDWVVIGDEKIRYTSKDDDSFSVPAVDGRGYDETSAVSHGVGSMVQTGEMNVINAALGFNTATAGTTAGTMEIIMVVTRFFTVTLPHLITWDFGWLKEGNMQWLRIGLLAISAGFLITMALTIVSALGGVAQAIFRRP